MEKNIQKIKIKNQLELWAFCAVIGTAAGALVWALLKIMAIGTEMIWEWIPEKNPYSVLYGARVYCGRSHYRDISKVIRGLSGRYGNSHGKSKERKKIRI